MRNGYIIQTLPSVDIQEIVKIGGKVTQAYEGVIYRENSKKSPFKKVINYSNYKNTKTKTMMLCSCQLN